MTVGALGSVTAPAGEAAPMPAAMVADRPIKAIKNLAAVRFCRNRMPSPFHPEIRAPRSVDS